jgi:hypothetical protein
MRASIFAEKLEGSFASVAGPDLIAVGLILTVIGLPIVLALVFNRRFQRLNPTKRPYRWGYYISVQSLFTGIGIGLQLKLGAVVVCSCAAVYGLLGWFFAKRRHWAWVTLSVISLNPIVWIVNPFYLRKRWNEDVVTH